MSIIFAPIFIIAGEQKEEYVGVAYIAECTGLKERTILEGKAGTRSLLRLRVVKRPSSWRRADVDQWIADSVKRKEREKKEARRPRLIRRERGR